MSTLFENEYTNNTDNCIPNETTQTDDPVLSDCKRNFRIYKQLSEISNSSSAIAKKKFWKTQLHIIVTNKRVKVYGKWDKDRLLTLLIDRLLQRARTKTAVKHEKVPIAEVKPILVGVPLHPIIHRGIYSEKILTELYLDGMSEHHIIRTMKFGLRNLEPEELYHFRHFGVTPELLKSKKSWSQYLDEALIENLNAIGLNDRESFKIITHGIISRSESCLIKLVLAGIDISAILNWQGPTIPVCTRMMQFLRKIGINEDILQLIVQKGIDEETREMLRDLGYTETEKEEHPGMKEVITCECSLTILEMKSQSSGKTRSEIISHDYNSEKMSNACVFDETTSTNTDDTAEQVACNCRVYSQNGESTRSESIIERNDYLRQTIMVPLTWAMEKALRYKPTDPKHYIAYQLLRWNYGNVSQTEMDNIRNIVIKATRKMDKQFAECKDQQKRELTQKLNKEILKNIPCQSCLKNYYQLHRVKERCWKCIKEWVPEIESCEFAEVCSSCKFDLSGISKSESTSFSSNELEVCAPELQHKDNICEVESHYSQISMCSNEKKKDKYEDYKSRENSMNEKIEQITEHSKDKTLQEKTCCPWPCELPISKYFRKSHS